MCKEGIHLKELLNIQGNGSVRVVYKSGSNRLHKEYHCQTQTIVQDEAIFDTITKDFNAFFSIENSDNLDAQIMIKDTTRQTVISAFAQREAKQNSNWLSQLLRKSEHTIMEGSLIKIIKVEFFVSMPQVVKDSVPLRFKTEFKPTDNVRAITGKVLKHLPSGMKINTSKLEVTLKGQTLNTTQNLYRTDFDEGDFVVVDRGCPQTIDDSESDN
jgi:hypothetical protein